MAHTHPSSSSSSSCKIILKRFHDLECQLEKPLEEKKLYRFRRSGECDFFIDDVSQEQACITTKSIYGDLKVGPNGVVSLSAIGNDCHINDEEILAGISRDLHNGDDFCFGRSSKTIFRLEMSPKPDCANYKRKTSVKYEFKNISDLITGEVRFSNSDDIKPEDVTFQIIRNIEAVEQYNTLIDLEGDYIAKPYHIEVGQISFIIFKKHLKNFDSWLADLEEMSWHQEMMLNFVKDIFKGLLFLYTKKGRCHGNLLSGILVTKDNKVLFTKIPKNVIGYVLAMRKDVLDVARIICKISEAHRKKNNDDQVPDKVERFLEFLKKMLLAESFTEENLYWVTSNPMCWDVEETFRFYYNIDDLYNRLDFKNDNIRMVRKLRTFGLARWQASVPPGTVLYVTFRKGLYNDEMSIIPFIRNAIEHFNENRYALYKVYENISDVDILLHLESIFPTLCFDLFEFIYQEVIDEKLTLGSSENFLNSAHRSSAPKYQRLQ